jgi:hypothetical protein
VRDCPLRVYGSIDGGLGYEQWGALRDKANCTIREAAAHARLELSASSLIAHAGTATTSDVLTSKESAWIAPPLPHIVVASNAARARPLTPAQRFA